MKENHNSTALFITGTDTEIGKTYTCVGLLKAFNQLGYTTTAIKPIASGCSNHQNDDALALQAAASIKLEYQHLNPYSFTPAIAPHIAAAQINCELTTTSITKAMQPALQKNADICIIEGVGGWQVPINTTETMADVVIHNQFPVILVVGIRLGCLNHALLTYSNMRQAGVDILGWIANCITPGMPFMHENIASLQTMLQVPHLGTVNYNEKPEEKIAAEKIITLLQDRRITRSKRTHSAVG